MHDATERGLQIPVLGIQQRQAKEDIKRKVIYEKTMQEQPTGFPHSATSADQMYQRKPTLASLNHGMGRLVVVASIARSTQLS